MRTAIFVEACATLVLLIALLLLNIFGARETRWIEQGRHVACVRNSAFTATGGKRMHRCVGGIGFRLRWYRHPYGPRAPPPSDVTISRLTYIARNTATAAAATGGKLSTTF